MRTEHKRVKHGETPGQVNRSVLIALRECRRPQAPEGFALHIVGDHRLNERDAASFKRYLKSKSKPVQRRRDRSAIRDGLSDVPVLSQSRRS